MAPADRGSECHGLAERQNLRPCSLIPDNKVVIAKRDARMPDATTVNDQSRVRCLRRELVVGAAQRSPLSRCSLLPLPRTRDPRGAALGDSVAAAHRSRGGAPSVLRAASLFVSQSSARSRASSFISLTPSEADPGGAQRLRSYLETHRRTSQTTEAVVPPMTVGRQQEPQKQVLEPIINHGSEQ
jgi:hypothetical protein